MSKLAEPQSPAKPHYPPDAYPSITSRMMHVLAKTAPVPVPTGIAPLDELLRGGLMPSSLSVICAGAGKGKTGLLIQLALYWLSLGWPVIFIETELDERQLHVRIISQLTDREWINLYYGNFDELGLSYIRAQICERLESLFCHWDWRDGQSIPNIIDGYEAKIGRKPIVVLDHMGDLARTIGGDPIAATSKVVRDLKLLAIDRELTIVAISQVPRSFKTGKRVGNELQGAAKNSGDVEYDCSGVLVLETKKMINGFAPAEIHVSKARGAPGDGKVDLRFNGKIGTFRALTDEEARNLQKTEESTQANTLATQVAVESSDPETVRAIQNYTAKHKKPIGIKTLSGLLKVRHDKASERVHALVLAGVVVQDRKGIRLN